MMFKTLVQQNGSTDLVGLLIAAFLTMLVFSYILGDNRFFRFVLHIFIGVSAGFVGAVALRNVIIPQLVYPLLKMVGGDFSSQNLLNLIPLGLSVLLLTKLSRRLNTAGNVALAYLVGIGAAAAIGGAVLGTLFPQINSAIDLLDMNKIPADQRLTGFLSSIVAFIGTISAFIYFHFSARPRTTGPGYMSRLMELLGKTGQVFIAITFGSMFAGALTAAVIALIERLVFLSSFISVY